MINRYFFKEKHLYLFILCFIFSSSFPLFFCFADEISNPVIDQSAGFWEDSFSDSNGISTSSFVSISSGSAIMPTPQTWTQSSANDFGAGTLTDVEASSTPGDVKLMKTYFDWEKNGKVFIGSSSNSENAQIISDGQGGMIIAWNNWENNEYSDVYVQRVNASGTSLWAEGGVAVETADHNQYLLHIVSDENGGAFIVWVDYRGTDEVYNRDVYIQKVNASGEMEWQENGIPLAVRVDDQDDARLVSDDLGGVIVVWNDFYSGSHHLQMQRITSDGTILWGEGGKTISVGQVNGSTYPAITSDGEGGAIVIWENSGGDSNSLIRVQRVNASGTPLWNEGGVGLTVSVGSQGESNLLSDGEGGVFATWTQASGNYGVHVQRVNASGTPLWTEGGVLVSSDSGLQLSPQIISDDSGGIIVSWNDSITSEITNTNVHVQRVNASGTPLWTEGGIPITNISGQKTGPSMASDGEGGAFIVWTDARNRVTFGTDIYIQKVNASGEMEWQENGIPLASMTRDQESPYIISRGEGGAFAIWDNYGTGIGLSFQKINTSEKYFSYPASFLSSPYDSEIFFSSGDISWSENLLNNTDVTLQTRSGASFTASWTDNFDDGLTTNVDDGTTMRNSFGEMIAVFQSVMEEDGVLTFSNPGEGAVVFPYIDTGKSEGYFPAGSTVTARIKVNTSAEEIIIAMFPDITSFETETNIAISYTKNEWVTLEFNSSIALNKIYFYIGPLTDLDSFQIDSLTISPSEGMISWSDWSSEVTDSSGSTITSPAGRYIQYRANLSTTDGSVTPILSDVTIRLAASSSFISTSITPTAISSWKDIAITDTKPASTTISYQVLYSNAGTWELVSDSALTGNSTGFSSSPIDISSLNSTTYPEIRIKANLSSVDASHIPSIQDIRVSWNLPVLAPSGGGSYTYSGGAPTQQVLQGDSLVLTSGAVGSVGTLSPQQPVTIISSLFSQASFSVPSSGGGSTAHHITVTSFNPNTNTVTLRIESTPQIVTLSLSELKKIDVDNDGIPDISIQLANVDAENKLNISLSALSKTADSIIPPHLATSTIVTPQDPLSLSFIRNLSTNMIGDDVRQLQIFLNTHGFPVTDTGLGSKGNETKKFGALTRRALIKFQKANNISPAVGFFGPITRGVVEKIIAEK